MQIVLGKLTWANHIRAWANHIRGVSMFDQKLLTEIRARFHHVERCPYQGERVYFENAGGALTLKSVVEVNARLSAIPDNQGRDNAASAEMMRLIARGRADMMTFLGAKNGGVFVGESGTECLFRVIRAAVLAAMDKQNAHGGRVLGSTLEHPATASAARQWAAHAEMEYVAVPHDPQSGGVDVDAYRRHLTADTRVATIIQTSPVTGIAVDVKAIADAIRTAAPECFIIVDGIQHAPHGNVSVADLSIDGYAISAYKTFSRHNYGFAWVSPQLATAAHDRLDGTADDFWELGTRDAAEYATFSEVVDYLAWLGGHFTDSKDRRAQLIAAADAITAHEKYLVEVMLHGERGGNGNDNGGGNDGQRGLADMPQITVLGGIDNPHREGLVSLVVDGMPAAQVVRQLGDNGIRVHIRKSDYFSANILTPLGYDSCVRVSMCHYNSAEEVGKFLGVMEGIGG